MRSIGCILVVLIDKVHHDLYHNILLLCTAFGNHQSQGSVTHAGTSEHAEGTQVVVQAQAKLNYAFLRWSDGRTENPRTIVAVKQFELTAIFHSVRTEEFWFQSGAALLRATALSSITAMRLRLRLHLTTVSTLWAGVMTWPTPIPPAGL